MFFGTKHEVDISFFSNRVARLDFAVLYYSIAINFLILSYCLHYPKGLDKRVTRLILIVTSLDLVHLIVYAKQGFGVVKIGIAILIFIAYDIYKKRYANN